MDSASIVAEFRAELRWHLRCSEKTAEISAHHVRVFLAHYEAPFPDCFDYLHVIAWLDHLASTPPRRRDKGKREASTVNGHLKSLKRFARWAVARGLIASNPIEKIKGLAEADRVIVAPEPETMGKILSVSSRHGSSAETRARNYAIISALIDIGPRANEMVAMDIDEVLDGQGNIREWCILHGKGMRDRAVAINPLLRDALTCYLPLRRARLGEKALWLTEQVERMGYVAFRGIVQRICDKAGVRVALHDFRRYALTQMWLDGMEQINGMLISGHSNPTVFQRYIRGGMQQRALQEHRRHSPLGMVSR